MPAIDNFQKGSIFRRFFRGMKSAALHGDTQRAKTDLFANRCRKGGNARGDLVECLQLCGIAFQPAGLRYTGNRAGRHQQGTGDLTTLSVSVPLPVDFGLAFPFGLAAPALAKAGFFCSSSEAFGRSRI